MVGVENESRLYVAHNPDDLVIREVNWFINEYQSAVDGFVTGHKVLRLDEMTGHELNEDLINSFLSL